MCHAFSKPKNMNNLFEKPLVVFDLETTGTDVVKDKIVSLAAIKMFSPTNLDKVKKIMVNPGMPIPAGATEVHGITDAMVADCPAFKAYAKALSEYLWGCNLAGYNIKNFDVSMLAEEFARCGITFPIGDTAFIDACNIFKAKEQRDLAAAVKFYTGGQIEDAHSAEGDVISTIRVLFGQMERYEDLSAMTVKELDLFCSGGVKTADLAGKIAYDEQGHPVYNFGKSKGVRVVDDSGFGLWMLKQDFPTDTKNVVKKILGIR